MHLAQLSVHLQVFGQLLKLAPASISIELLMYIFTFAQAFPLARYERDFWILLRAEKIRSTSDQIKAVGIKRNSMP